MNGKLPVMVAGAAALIVAACEPADPENASFGPASANNQTSAKAVAGSGPFGIDLARGLEGLDLAPREADGPAGFHRLNSVPSPHPDFDSYAVVAYPNVGICEIRAVSDPEQDQYGVHGREIADRLAAALSTRYGEPEKLDRCGGLSCEAEFWTMQLSQGSRYYLYEWDNARQQPRAVRPRYVSLSVQAPDIIQTFVRIDYAFGNEQQCEQAARTAGASNL